MAKIGRNQPCPCGSNKKYKKCHGAPTESPTPIVSPFDKAFARSEALRIQQQRQQGLGKPIISAEYNGTRIVAVKNRIAHSKKWKTFEDFLFAYIPHAMGPAWGNAELTKRSQERHPILTWFNKIGEQQAGIRVDERGKVRSGPMTGAIGAYLHLAYDLYSLDHNAELQAKLIARLRNRDNFAGARYEVYVAANFIRAGFEIEFENEDDGNSTHCEFTATYPESRKSFSVEAKRCGNRRSRIGSLFNAALVKRALHPRVIFIDMNTRDDAQGLEEPDYSNRAMRRLRSFEGQPLNNQPRPPAYVFLTNTPFDLYLDTSAPRCTLIAEGFQIPDFKRDARAPLREVLNARARHREMHELIKSIMDHSEIPSTFDGEIPEFAFERHPRILVGERYLVPDANGIELSAEVTTATVDASARTAFCAVVFADGRSGIWTVPLTDAEMDAWRRHPDTFFGVPSQRKMKAETPIELYDFIFDASSNKMSKEQLLAALDRFADDGLQVLSQAELASIHAERLTNAAFAATTQPTPQGKPGH